MNDSARIGVQELNTVQRRKLCAAENDIQQILNVPHCRNKSCTTAVVRYMVYSRVNMPLKIQVFKCHSSLVLLLVFVHKGRS